ncbi:hypothetical protein GCM10010222_81260 [Streptomyces tanashiensis]|uniref:hypothetical protein n=1 Tax=Streptomyces tanashiensis TaxID=67367 RepID=UPI001678015B|nr:hypothetical protein [Streptomyces tanashiensis]GGT27218.1 hypothetical protein GCM10010222_81260 [Streptomyces tanashiensis]
MTTDQRPWVPALPDLDPERDGNACVPGALAAGIAVVAHFFCVLVVGFSTMATDSCGPDDCALAVTGPLTVMYGAYYATYVLTPLAVIASLVLPWRRRWRRTRTRLAVLALLPQAVIAGSLFALLALGE